MRLIAHISDIHFGAEEPVICDGLREYLHRVRPEITVVSGDLTQRARRVEFDAARAFVHALPGAKIIVPGNHDVPLWDFFNRFFRPLARYCRYITPDLAPTYHDECVSIVGINTARSLTSKNGRINEDQARAASEILRRYDEHVMKIVVTHHPFDLAETHGERDLVGRSKMALQMLAEAGADVLLAGHFHDAYTGGTAKRYPIHGYSALVVQAGTATSHRRRGSANSFNLLRIDPPFVTVEILSWDDTERQFTTRETKRYERRPEVGFVRLDAHNQPG